MSSATPQYLAFVMFPDRISVAVWKKINGNIQILSQSSVIEALSGLDDDLSRAIDTALDELGPEGLNVKEALFVVAPDWVENGDLSAKKKHFLKVLTHDLMLEPLGYVVLSDTILAHEASQSPQTFSGVIIYDTAREWIIELAENGQVQSTQKIGKSQDHTADHTELQSRLKTLSGVKRAILVPLHSLSQAESESSIQTTLSTSLEVLAPSEVLRIAVSIGGAEILLGNPEKAAEVTEQTSDTPNITETDDFQTVDLAALENLEQELDEDMAQDAEIIPPSTTAHSPTVWDVEPQEGGRVTEVSPAGFVIHRSAQDAVPDENIEYVQEFDINHAPPRRAFKAPKISFAFLAPLKAQLLSGKKKPLMIGVAAVLILLSLGLAGAYWQISQTYTATASVWLQPQTVEQNFTFSAGATSASSSGTLPLPGEIISETITVDTEVPTTGTKVTGDPASGDVTIFNKTSQARTFAAGTRISGDGKVFELINEVTIASSSSDIASSTHGKGDVRVRALEIGPEGNIGKDVRFTVANFDTSSYEAISKDPFSGGTKREIQAVSQKDIDTAAQQLRVAAQEQLNDLFEQRKQEGNTLFPSGQVAVTAISASPKLNEEAKFVTVSLTASSNALQLTADQSSQEGQKLLSEKVSANQELLPDTVEFVAQNVTVSPDGRTFLLTANVTGQAVERLLAEDLKREVAGLYAARAETILGEKSGVARQEVIIEPTWIRWMFSNLPKDYDRIKLNIKLDRTQ